MALESNDDSHGSNSKFNDTQSLVSVGAADDHEEKENSDEENEKEILMMEEVESSYSVSRVGGWRLPWRSKPNRIGCRKLNKYKKGKKSREDDSEGSVTYNPFRFADKRDVTMMIVGSFCMMTLGAAMPLNTLFIGRIITQFVALDSQRINNVTTLSECVSANGQRLGEGSSAEEVMAHITTEYIPICVGLGSSALVLSYLGITLWTWTGARQIRRIRVAYFRAIMRQSVGWFDVQRVGELNSRMVSDVERLQDVFGDKMAIFIQSMSAFIGSFLLSFLTSWKLTAIVLAVCPLIVFVVGALGRVCKTLVKREIAAYAKAGSVAEETFSSIRTVAAFGGEKKLEEKYTASLHKAFRQGVQKAGAFGISSGLFWFFKFCINGLALWYGAKLVYTGCLQFGDIMVVFVCLSYGSQSLGWAAPMLIGIRQVQAAAALLFKTIDTPVAIDSLSDEGTKPESLEGNIDFVEVGFSYPARQETQVLNGLNLTVRKGETVALVGESGCGKSTTLQLIQRFYECDEGKVLIDGEDLKDYNLTWLRNYMGVVSQEPVLFATTIGENIRLGSKWGDEITQEQIETAAKQANCYDFITKLPKGFDTLVGERGIQLSGGQKQRIAIARALVRNPVILLLDEATSALDTQSEAIVQDALDKASKGRTTLVVAHRLSTVKAADKIYAFRDGQVHEEGTHDQLMSKKGLYHSLVMKQMQKEEEEAKEQDPKQDIHGSTKPTSGRYQRSVSRTSAGSDNNFIEATDKSNMMTEEEIDRESEADSESVPEPDIKIGEILAMNKPEWHVILFGVLCSVIAGTIQPVYAMLVGAITETFTESHTEESLRRRADLIGYMIVLGAVAAIAYFLQHLAFGVSGERLTRRLRNMSFKSMLHQDISYFDNEEHAVGSLTSRLSTEAPLVKGATGIRLGLLAQALTTMLGTLLIAFLYIWELALVLLCFMPIVVLTGKIRQRVHAGASKRDRKTIAEGGKIAHEAISNMRTVTSLNQQRYFTDKFFNHFKLLHQNNQKGVFAYGIAYSVSQGMTFFFNVIIFGIGGYISVCDCMPWRSEIVPFPSIVRIFTVALFGSTNIGQTISQLPDYLKAKLAAFSIKELLQTESQIDSTSPFGEAPASCDGKVTLTDVRFHYPTRPSVQVLQGVSFTVKKGETLALVGSSGCGKSTSVSLLERFYDCTDGVVTIDGRDVKSLNIQWLRHNLGLVSQEPTLFDTSIAENIAYGDNTREVSMAEIIQVATKANAHNFITSLPDGYETNVGAKGTQLSGGQKQRIAIARALIRNPAVLLLDEATSALDTESEKVVQEALDEALVGRTAIIIAHRLSTIRNANNIGVIDNGKIVEFGTHEQLLEKKGFYFDLVNAQL